ncbi:MAG: Two component, sigma54 specific, transcriptional regulator, Fis family [Desulfonauticus sp. 38_4375]|nr:MAG: Two component, sigma54 specific, transcriptional regulator, Fis family [Desulfonauticus sp. 38_4375]
MSSKILIVDDDKQLRKSFSRLLSLEGYEVESLGSAEETLDYLANTEVDLVVLDYKLPKMDGLSCLKTLKRLYPELPVIIMTAYGTSHTAIEAMKIGALDYVLKPFEVDEFLFLIKRALKNITAKEKINTVDSLPVSKGEILIGKSRAMQEVYKSIGKISSTQANVLILGETGTGKELVAKAIHQYSERASKPFVVVNCVAIPETLLESELFGYEKGAFTGADKVKKGKVELAQGGTLFLDEIGDMPLAIQSKLLRLLEAKSIERLGSSTTFSVDVRIIAATNRDLQERVKTGDFREDLYYRLQVLTLYLPPLRERKGDIPLLLGHYLQKCSEELKIEKPSLSKEALDVLENYSWPGNVRELRNTVTKLLIQSSSRVIGREEVEKVLFTERPSCLASPEELPAWALAILENPEIVNKWQVLTDCFQVSVLKYCLEKFQGNKSQVARCLGVTRPTILNKLENLDQLHSFLEKNKTTN